MADKEFPVGMNVKRRNNAPEFVICNLGFKQEEFAEYLRQKQKNGWVNIDIKRSKSGKLYADLDTWEPNQQNQQNQQPASNYGVAPELDDDLAF